MKILFKIWDKTLDVFLYIMLFYVIASIILKLFITIKQII
jgi:hypothetical protein